MIENKRYTESIEAIEYLTKRLNDEGYKYSIEPHVFVLPNDCSYFGCHTNRKGVDMVTNMIIDILK